MFIKIIRTLKQILYSQNTSNVDFIKYNLGLFYQSFQVDKVL